MVLVIINWPHAGAGDNTEDSSLWMTQARSFAQINKELLQKPELFYRKPRIHGGNTGDIATRSIEAQSRTIGHQFAVCPAVFNRYIAAID